MTSMTANAAIEMSGSEFHDLRKLVLKYTGITLSEAKVELVRRRFGPRLRALKLPSYSSYARYIENGHAEEISHFSDAITTNLTSFFRESHHFDELAATVSDIVAKSQVAENQQNRRLRIWSAGCSSGQEAYCIAMTLRECIANIGSWDVKILATDLDSNCLKKGAAGIYNSADIEKIASGKFSDWAARWFAPCDTGTRRAKDELRSLITFRRLNFMDKWPMSGPFDVIFCRNVFIYFDKEMQKSCLEKFSKVQRSGDRLFLGHSESVNGITDDYKLTSQTVYLRH